MATIQVKYRALASVGGKTYYHKYIVYDDGSGDLRVAHAFPKGTNHVPTETGIIIVPSDGESDYGLIDGREESFVPGEDDWVSHETDPYETIASGADLEAEWEAVKEAIDEINAYDYVYQPTLQNSNSWADAVLDGAGLSAPTNDGPLGNWAPGSGLPLQYVPSAIGLYLPLFILDGLIAWFAAPSTGSPLVLDLDNDGVELTTFSATTTQTFFDIDGDGFAEQTAWVGADDGLLARDLDDSGTIDSVAELFGSPSVDGFALLAELDDNGDHVINQYDAAWSELVVWKDADGDAVTDTGELHSLASLNIVSFDLAGITASTSTISGNPISHTSTYTLSGGSTRTVADAWFVHSNVNSIQTGEYALDERVFLLPSLRGFGELKNLHIAMSENEDLLELVQSFFVNWDISRFEDGASLDGDIEDILFTWAGVESVTTFSRGPNIDAKILEFMEEYLGNEYLQFGTDPNPGATSAGLVKDAWDIIFANLKAQLIIQAGGSVLFDGTITYSIFSGELEGDMDLSQGAIDDLEAAAPAPGIDLVAYWEEVARLLDASKGLANLTGGENTMMNNAIVATDAMLTWAEVKTFSEPGTGSTINGTSGADTLNGTAASETINGNGGTDLINGGAGHDTISAGAGDDTVYGGSGNDQISGSSGDNYTLYGEDGDDTLIATGGADVLDGGAGNDTLTGGYGNDILRGGSGGDVVEGGHGDDIYEYASGNHFYTDTSGADTIKLASGITSGDLSFFQMANGGSDGQLVIVVDGAGTIETPFIISGGTLLSSRIETLMFADTSTFNFASITALTTYGNYANNSLYGVNFGSHANDTIYGLGGNDQLDGNAGDDILDGGDGNDRLIGDSGNDTYIASAGYDIIEESSSGTDVIMLPAGYDASNLTFIRPVGSPNNLEITIDGLGQIKIDSQFFSGGAYAVETISFNGVSTLNLTTAQIETLGGSGDDTLNAITSGASTNDIMDGREGNDMLNGDMGNDTYFFSIGDDVIGEQGGTDTIQFREAWVPGSITLYRQGYALYAEDQNGNSMKVQQQFTEEGGSNYSTYEVEQIVFADSTTWTLSSIEVQTKGTASGETIYGTTDGDASSADTIYGLGGGDTIDAGAGNDWMHGGDGNDGLYGAGGNDTYVFSAGLDTFYEGNSGDGTDTILVTGGATINDVTVSNYSSQHTKIVLNSGTDEVTIQYLRAGDTRYEIENITFDDGFSTDLMTYSSWIKGTSGADTVAGNSSDNTLIGYAGNDTITSGSGNDEAHGGAGDDTLYGDGGTDLLHGGVGADVLYGGDGLDTLFGGAGADTFKFQTASAFNHVDVVKDFSTAQADIIDLTDILGVAYNPLSDAIADFVSFSESSGSTFVSVDRDGTAGVYSMAQIIKLENVTGLASAETLETNGNLIAA
ncbi:type I secretion C-terminal target domain-containing protein [Sinorhizobium meliloti]|uniref:calcium-binding protein n=1 Tax=Rhizobium meliloti TaxID=382 RepID=UPI000FDC5CCF|nr:calcium-binding protein [Sinorhizobium meliloti]RVH60075.1 type I secretion C-terminal target domain-containing protein [Sinorhizobium meliloti]